MATSGEERLRGFIASLPITYPAEDTDTATLQRRFPHLAGVSVEQVSPLSRAYRGASSTGVGLVWVHGGAFITGDLDMPESHWVALELASRGIDVLALDYRKALGGVRHPVPSDDVLAGWHSAPSVLGVANLHLAGSSAGANLCAGIIARGARPTSLALVYPMVHAVLPVPSRAAAAAASALSAEERFDPSFVRALNLNYVGTEDALDDPIAFPALGDPSTLPPTLIITAESDDLRPSGESYAAQVAAAGVDVTLELEPATRHGYLDFPGSPAAVSTLDRVAEWVIGS